MIIYIVSFKAFTITRYLRPNLTNFLINSLERQLRDELYTYNLLFCLAPTDKSLTLRIKRKNDYDPTVKYRN